MLAKDGTRQGAQLLPKWFTRLHPKHKTPTNSILFVAGVALVLGLLTVAGAAAGIVYALAYLVMFALPLFGFRDESVRPPLWLKAAAVSGFLMTALYTVLSIVPIIDVPSPFLFAGKITGFVLLAELAGAFLYWGYQYRSKPKADTVGTLDGSVKDTMALET